MVRQRLRIPLANAVPALGRIVRFLRAAADRSGPTRSSYAQHGEDAWILRALGGKNLDGAIYVDVGAYHPSRLSNTYLLYRQGLRGVLVEPNPEMAELLRLFRPGDQVIAAGCDSAPGVKPLFVYSTPADTSFAAHRVARNESEKGLRRTATLLTPVLPIDVILDACPYRWICLLSIDAEGLDHAVLEGAERTLQHTLFVCVECSSTNPDSVIAVTESMAGRRFQLVHEVSWNRIYENASLRERLQSAGTTPRT